MINPFDINLIDLKVQKYSLRIIDFKLNTKYFTSRTPFLINFYIRVHWILTAIFGLYSIISGALGLSSNYFSNLGIFLFFFVFGFFLFSKPYRRLYYQTLYVSSLCLLGSLLYYQWTNLEISEIYTNCLSALVFTFNFNLNLFYLFYVNSCYHLLMYIRYHLLFLLC